jgi:plastocyanin
MIKRSAIALVALFMAFGAVFGVHYAQALTSYDDLQAGDLIRGQTFTAVYYLGADGMRYVFPNDKTYFTWYTDFDDVKWISDTDLAKIQIGGNVTYKPGVRMIKINSDPKTYAVSSGGVLRHIGSESLAVSLYGSTWNTKIDDVPDGFFSNYTIGSEITSTSDYSPSLQTASAENIGNDKGLIAPEEISITSIEFDPVCVGIEVGQGVRFTNDDSTKHSVTADNLRWGSGTMNAGDEYIKVFKDDGVYPFYDGYDSSSTGAIYVGSYSDDCVTM